MSSTRPRLETASRSRWARHRHRIIVAVLILFAVFCAATARLFIWPTTGMPARVDAIVVPGGHGDRLGVAIDLARQGRARYLVLSEGMYIPSELCGTRIGTARVICFRPDPDTTQGEAEATSRLARQHGWHSIVLVTSPDQTWRAELRFRRCYSEGIYGVTTPLPLHLWPFRIAYQWAATAKAGLLNHSY